MTSKTATDQTANTNDKPVTMFGPDFPFAYDDYLAHPDGIGSIPKEAHGTKVAIIGGGLSGLVAAYHLAQMGLEPVIYEAEKIGGRMRTERFEGQDDDITAEMGAMRFPISSVALNYYLDHFGLETKDFPNPLTPATTSTVIDLKGETSYIESPDQLPAIYDEVAQAWANSLRDFARADDLSQAIRDRNQQAVREIWGELISKLDNETFYGFLTSSDHFADFNHREIFGQVGFGTGGWDTDYPNSMLEILRVTATEADDHHRGIVGGSDRLPWALWQAPIPSVGAESGTDGKASAESNVGPSLQERHNGTPRPGVTKIELDGDDSYIITDSLGRRESFPLVISATQSWILLSNIDCDENLLPMPHWTSVERTHYMGSSKVFVLVDRPFWLDKDDNGRDVMSMTLTDRMPRGTYLLDNGPDRPGVICLSYTWSDDSLRLLPLNAQERMDIMLRSLEKIYPDVDIRSHIIDGPRTITWEAERNFMGAFKANLPGHYRYQERLYTHFMQRDFEPQHRGFFLAGDDVSWTAGWAEGAIQTALNAVWGVMNHLGGSTPESNPGPGDVFDDIRPFRYPDAD